MHKLYSSMLDSVQGPELKQLIQSQENWQRAKSTRCNQGALPISGKNTPTDLSKGGNKVCQLRELQQRIRTLQKVHSAQQARQPIQVDPQGRLSQLHDFIETTLLPKREGKWYFEVTLDEQGILQSQTGIAGDWPIGIWIGCADMMSGYDVGAHIHLQRGASKIGRETLGFALDLDQNQLYLRRNGVWQSGQPNSNNGKSIQQGIFQCGINAVIAIQPLTKAGLLTVNFGQQAFISPAPEGYRPMQIPMQWILAGEESDRKTFVDYRQLQANTGAPTLFIRQEFKEARDSGPELTKHIARIAEIAVDCNNEQVKEVALTQLDRADRPIAFSQNTRTVDHRPGNDNLGGRLVKSVCFLRHSDFRLPDATPQETWEEMESPVSSVRISEAPKSRQIRNGLLLIKQKNETSSMVDIFGKQSNTLIAFSALDCSTMNAVQLVGVRYDKLSNPIGIDFIMPPSTIRLEKNRTRFQEACRNTGR